MNNPPEGLKVTRDELYRRVWATPMQRLAKEFNVSDVALAKVCRKLNIPRPPRGHWRRVELGYRVKQALLPPADAQTIASVTIRGALPRGEKKEAVSPALVFPEGAFIVRPDLRACHPLTTHMRATLEQHAGIIEYGMMVCRVDGCLHVRVSKKGLHRVLRVLDAIVRGAEAMGWDIDVSSHWGSGIKIANQTVSFRLFEKITRHFKASSPDYPVDHYEHEATGKLQLSLEGYYVRRRTFSDGKRLLVEEKLRDFATAVFECAQAQQLAADKREEERRRWALEEARRVEHERRRQAEADCRCRLKAAFANWQESQNLTGFLTLCEKKLRAGGVDPKGDTEPCRWLRWARAYAQQLDPFERDFPLKESVADFSVGKKP